MNADKAGSKGYTQQMFTPGMVTELAAGDEAQLINPQGQATDAATYVKLLQRLVSSGQGLSYEAVARDMSGSTYSSTRQNLIEDGMTYAINANVWKTLIDLCADICERHNIKELKWMGEKGLIGQIDLQNMTVHRWFANKSCPGDYIYNRLGQIAKEVNQKLGGVPAWPFKAYQGQVNADDGLNCRTSPVSGQVLKTYPDGTVLTITKEESNWGWCGEGWVCLDYINKIASAKDEPAKEDAIMEGKQFKKFFDEMRQQWRDNDASDYSAEARKWAVDNGLITGSSTEEFNGMWEDLMTREQLVTVLYRFAKIMGAVPTSDSSK